MICHAEPNADKTQIMQPAAKIHMGISSDNFSITIPSRILPRSTNMAARSRVHCLIRRHKWPKVSGKLSVRFWHKADVSRAQKCLFLTSALPPKADIRDIEKTPLLLCG